MMEAFEDYVESLKLKFEQAKRPCLRKEGDIPYLIFAPFMNRFFRSALVSLDSWAQSFAVGLCIYVLVGIEEWLRFRGEKSHLLRRTS